MHELTIGEEFADHRIDALIGRGGMGLVYRATQLTLERPVALKLIAPELAGDQSFRDRFRQECRLAASLDHPNIVAVHEAGDEDGRLYVTMRLVDGTDLRREIDDSGALDPRRAAEIVAQIGNALDAAHARGLVHRDVKPGNVLLAAGGASGHETAYLTDFGLSKQAGTSDAMTRTGHWVGTVDYVAPEQIRGAEVDARTDVYALGCVLYEALAGEAPFAQRAEVAKMFAHLNDPPPALPERVVADFPELGTVVARAMAKDPADRYPSAGDLGRAALAAVAHEPVAEPERTVARGDARPAHAPAETRVSATPAPPLDAPDPLPAPPVAPDPTREQAMAEPAYHQAAGRRRRTIAATGLAALAAGVAVILAAGGLGGGSGSTTSTTTPTTTPVTAGVPRSAVRSALTRYERAYSDQDLAGVGALLTAHVRRQSGNNPPQTTRAAALAEYARQFATLARPRYVLSALSIAPARSAATASAHYRITDRGAFRGAGAIRFHLIEAAAGLKIDELTIKPD